MTLSRLATLEPETENGFLFAPACTRHCTLVTNTPERTVMHNKIGRIIRSFIYHFPTELSA
jgi:hypothetical protein